MYEELAAHSIDKGWPIMIMIATAGDGPRTSPKCCKFVRMVRTSPAIPTCASQSSEDTIPQIDWDDSDGYMHPVRVMIG